MKGTEKIIAHIQADAEAQADAILAAAEDKAAGIREQFEAQAREVYAEKIRAGVKANQDRLDSMDRLAKMEGRKAVLALKQDMVSKSFDMATDKLVNLPEEQYVLFPSIGLKASGGKLLLVSQNGVLEKGEVFRPINVMISEV